MNGGAILWQEAVGERPEIAGHPALAGLDLPAPAGGGGGARPVRHRRRPGVPHGRVGHPVRLRRRERDGVVGGSPARAGLRQPDDLRDPRNGRQLVVIATGEREGAALLAFGL